MENKEYKFNCEKCKFYTNYKSEYKRHENTEKHKTGKKAVRSDKKYPEKCELCDYKPVNNKNYIRHKLTFHSTKEERKNEFAFYCEKCDFGTFEIGRYKTHLGSKKHNKMC